MDDWKLEENLSLTLWRYIHHSIPMPSSFNINKNKCSVALTITDFLNINDIVAKLRDLWYINDSAQYINIACLYIQYLNVEINFSISSIHLYSFKQWSMIRSILSLCTSPFHLVYWLDIIAEWPCFIEHFMCFTFYVTTRKSTVVCYVFCELLSSFVFLCIEFSHLYERGHGLN